MNSKIKIFLIIIGVLVFFIAIIITIPVKKAQKINQKFIEQEKISRNDTLLVCECDNTVTGTPWFVVGKNNRLFDLKEPCEYIILEGNLPKSILLNKLTIPPVENKFIFEGNFVNDVKCDGGVFKVFKVKKWSILYPIGREFGFMLPKNSITIYDYLPFP